MTRIIAYDLSRMLIGPIFATPRGVDRVDLALAKRVFADPETPNLAVLPTPWGMRAYTGRGAARLLDRLQELWSEQVDQNSDPQLAKLVERLWGPQEVIADVHPADKLTLGQKVARIGALLNGAGLSLGQPVRRAVPADAVYVNIGQLGLAVPVFYNWLADRPDVTCAMMLHDVIPLEHPDLVPPHAAAHHARMVRTAADHADCMIYNTATARRSVESVMRSHGRESVRSLVRALPLQNAFASVQDGVPQLADADYFVVVSTVEPRKNHALLIGIWQRLMARLGVRCPHLVIVGARGYDSDRILAPVDEDPVLSRRIHVVSGLSSPALAALVLGSKGMLSPTRTEGFGLPVYEANALGVPTIASDIPAHREIANAQTTLLSPDDADAWEQAIIALAPAGARPRPAIDPRLTEEAYCADVLEFLQAA